MRRTIIMLGIAATIIFGGIIGREGYRNYQELRSYASAAEAHLRAAESEMRAAASGRDFGRIAKARNEFSEARQAFARINGQINALGLLYSIAEAIPWAGGQASAARKVMRAGEYVSQAGEEASLAAEYLVEAGKRGSGDNKIVLVVAAVPIAIEHLSNALEAIDRAQEEYAGLPRHGLHPLLLKALNELDNQVPKQRALLDSGLVALRALPGALGSEGDRVYLVLIQDSAEIRPTGGFIGNYGIIRVRGGKMVEVNFNDTYLLDWPYYNSGKAPALPELFARYLPEATFWALRDANLWPDFERSARQAAWFAIAEGAAERVDGVIAITDDIVQPLMKAVGPITISDYEETVDERNILGRIRFHQTFGPSNEVRKRLGDKLKGNRKYFTSLVLKAAIERVNDLDISGMVGLATSLQDSFKSKALQVYFTEPALQGLVESYDLGGQVKASTGDYLWVIDMNLSASKDNVYVKPSVSYSVTVSATGEAISELEIVYDYNQQQGERFTGTVNRPFYGNYLRVYVPLGSRLLVAEGTDEPVETLSELGKTAFGGFIHMAPKSVRRVKLRYWQPHAVVQREGRTEYELIVQKQAGNDLQTFEVTVALPPEAAIQDPGPFVRSGRSLVHRGPLDSDKRFAVSFKLP